MTGHFATRLAKVERQSGSVGRRYVAELPIVIDSTEQWLATVLRQRSGPEEPRRFMLPYRPGDFVQNYGIQDGESAQ